MLIIYKKKKYDVIFPALVAGLLLEIVFLEFNGETVKLPEGKASNPALDAYIGKTVVLGIRPEDVSDDIANGAVTGDGVSRVAGVSPADLHAGCTVAVRFEFQAEDIILRRVAHNPLAGNGVGGSDAGHMVGGKALVAIEKVLLNILVQGFLNAFNTSGQGGVSPGGVTISRADLQL